MQNMDWKAFAFGGLQKLDELKQKSGIKRLIWCTVSIRKHVYWPKLFLYFFKKTDKQKRKMTVTVVQLSIYRRGTRRLGCRHQYCTYDLAIFVGASFRSPVWILPATTPTGRGGRAKRKVERQVKVLIETLVIFLFSLLKIQQYLNHEYWNKHIYSTRK